MLTDPNALAAKAWDQGCGAYCVAYEDATADNSDLPLHDVIAAGDAAAQAAIAAVIAPELERRDREIERLREVGAGAWVPAEQFIALRKELELAAKFIGGMKHTKAGEAAFERARTALGASHDADA